MFRCLWFPPVMEVKQTGVASPASLPCLCKHKDIRHNRTQEQDAPVPWTVGESTSCPNMGDTVQPPLKAFSILQDGAAINRFNGTYFVVWVSIFQENKTIQGRILMCWALFSPGSFPIPPLAALFPSFRCLNDESKAHATPKSSWKVKN